MTFVTELITMMGIIWHRYDERTTLMCETALQKLLLGFELNNGSVSEERLKQFATDVEKRMKFSFGTDDIRYIRFAVKFANYYRSYGFNM